MILKRIVDENGNEIYIKISFDDALKEEKSVLVFSSEEEEEEYDEALEEEEEVLLRFVVFTCGLILVSSSTFRVRKSLAILV